MLHATELALQASSLLDLEQAIAAGERDHGKWVRLLPEDFTALGLEAPSTADYLVIKYDGPNLGVHVFDPGSAGPALPEIPEIGGGRATGQEHSEEN